MTRVAYVMEDIMNKLGLSGKSFIPMLLGFGCSVPAIMATRTLERQKDRIKTILMIPFMSCSAKLPIYVLFSGMFFPGRAMLAAYSMYLLGIAIALILALVLHGVDKQRDSYMLIMELPEYKTPDIYAVLIYVWDKIREFLIRAGTIIFVASIFMWFILNFGFSGYVMEMGDSFGSVWGRYLVPFLAPVGLGFWQVGVALIAGLASKEVVVSSFAVLFGIANLASPEGMNTVVPVLADLGFGALNAYALMVFSLLYTPCFATLAIIKRETGSWKRLGLVFCFQIGVAWAVTFAVFHLGRVVF